MVEVRTEGVVQCGWSLLELYVGGAASLNTLGGLVTLNEDARRHAGLGLQTLTLSWVLSPVLTGPSTERRLDSIVCVCVSERVWRFLGVLGSCRNSQTECSKRYFR